MRLSRPLAAVALTAALALTACESDKPEPSPTTPSGAAETVTIDLAKLPKGAAPKVNWLDGTTLHIGDKAVQLSGDEIAEAAVTAEHIVTRGLNTAGNNIVQVRDRTGRITGEYPNQTSRLVTNAKRNVVAWIGDDGIPVAVQDGHADPIRFVKPDRGEAGDAIAINGHDCANGPETVEGAGCSIYFTVSRDKQTAPLVASGHGFVEDASRTIADLQDVSTGNALIGLIVANGPKLCSRYESEAKSYRTCDFFPTSFSPNGKRVIALPSEVTESQATDEFSLRDSATGKAIVTADSPKGTWPFWYTVWEDEDHVLALVQDGETRWGVVRLGLDGKAELALGPVKSEITRFRFATQP